MNNFTHGFWSLFIIIATLGGIAFCFWLIRWTSTGSPAPGETAGDTGHVWDEDLAELNNPLPRWWLIMFYLTLVFGILYLVLYPGLGSATGFLNWSSIGQYESEMKAADEKYGPVFEKFLQTPVDELSDNPDAQRVGSRLYAAYCTGCHGSDAAGNPGFPNLRDSDWQWGGAGDAIKTTIMAGRQGVMPPWADALGGDTGVHNVTHYVLSLSGAEHDAAAATAGKAQYDAMCVACHGPTGDGNPALGAPRLNDNVWLYGSGEDVIKHTIAAGRTGVMPAHQDLLGEAKVHVLAAYIQHLSSGK